MEIEEALREIAKLEEKLDQQEPLNPSEADQKYIDTLKADMRKAAEHREASEAKSLKLDKKLGVESFRNRVIVQAFKENCVDVDSFFSLMQQKGLPKPDCDEEQFTNWFAKSKDAHKYFFKSKDKKPDGSNSFAPVRPLTAAGTMKRQLNTQEMAAEAYRQG